MCSRPAAHSTCIAMENSMAARAEPRKVPLTGEASSGSLGRRYGHVRGRHCESATDRGRPDGAFQVDFRPRVQVAILLQRGIAFVTADEARGQPHVAARRREQHCQIAAGAFALAALASRESGGNCLHTVWDDPCRRRHNVRRSVRDADRQAMLSALMAFHGLRSRVTSRDICDTVPSKGVSNVKLARSLVAHI
jgi:hypothetical protein